MSSRGQSGSRWTIVPGGFEMYREELAEMMANEPSWPPNDMGPVMALMANTTRSRRPPRRADAACAISSMVWR